MKKNIPEESIQVNCFLDELEHPLKPLILEVRQVIFNANKALTEHLKWNAPSFCYNGEDRITMKLFPPKQIQVVFHRGAKAKEPDKKLITDATGLMKWASNDRAVVTFRSLEEIKMNALAFGQIINKWIEAAK